MNPEGLRLAREFLKRMVDRVPRGEDPHADFTLTPGDLADLHRCLPDFEPSPVPDTLRELMEGSTPSGSPICHPGRVTGAGPSPPAGRTDFSFTLTSRDADAVSHGGTMAYTTKNYQSKRALREDLAAGVTVTVFQAGPFGPEVKDGRVALEGPHFPEPHRWYASAVVKDGTIVPGSVK